MLLNDDVIELKMGLFAWRGLYYEVIPYKKIKKDKSTRVDHFVKYMGGRTLYGIREISKSLILKRYNLTITDNML